jgi:hypothetical protein
MGIYEERWKAIEGYEGLYEISDHGNARSLDRIDALGRTRKGTLLAPSQVRGGYYHVNLYKDGKQKSFLVHRLVAKAFCDGYAEGLYACHNDGDPTNNHYTNVRFDTPKNNQADRIKHGTHDNGELSVRSKTTNEQAKEIRKLYATGDYTQTKLAKMFDLAQVTISRIVTYKRYKPIEE